MYDDALKRTIRKLEAQLAQAERGGLQLQDPAALAAYLEQLVSGGAADTGAHLRESFNEVLRSFNSQRESEGRSAQRRAAANAAIAAAGAMAGGPARTVADAVASIQRMEEPAEQ